VVLSREIPLSIPVLPESPFQCEAARSVAERWGLPYLPSAESGLALVVDAAGVALRDLTPRGPGAVRVDLVGGPLGHRRRFGGGRNQAIARAVGLKRGWQPYLVDATAGLGRDAFILAWLGCRVSLVERSPVLAALLEDGLERARLDPEVGPVAAERMHLVHADAVRYLQSMAPAERPEVVYLDPMYPPTRRRAEVKKEMQLLHRLLGAGDAGEALLAAALSAAELRVVVKRPVWAPPLAGPEPAHAITTKNHRFDVYLQRR